MKTFDGWETQLYGDVLALPKQLSDDELMHFRTKGSKNGVRRYQTESGEWTPLGLKERKAREGWGEGRAKRKAEKLARKSERRAARKERVAAAKEAYIKRKAKGSLKNLSDDELQRRINRVKKEIEYKELTKNPVVKLGENLVKSYLEGKDKKLDRKMKKAELIIRQQEARQKTLASKAALTQARNSVIDNIIRGSKYKATKAKLIEAKANNTISGALKKSLNKIISKEGDRIVSEMGDRSIVMRGGRKVKSMYNKGVEKTTDALKKYYAKDSEAIAEQKRKKQKRRDQKWSRRAGSDLRG